MILNSECEQRVEINSKRKSKSNTYLRQLYRFKRDILLNLILSNRERD